MGCSSSDRQQYPFLQGANMNFPRFLTGFLLLFVSLFTLLVSADSRTPWINSVMFISNGAEPIVQIQGEHFGHNAANIQVMVNENGAFAKLLSADAGKLI